MTILFTILVFVTDTLSVVAAQTVLLIIVCLAAGISLKKVFRHSSVLAGLIVMVMVLQTLFGGGALTGLMICCRIIALVVVTRMLTITTGTQALAFGITGLGVHYQAAFIITTTLNLIPSFEEEARLIMDARRLRGIAGFEKSFFTRFKEYPAIVLPLMVKAMRKAQMMGLAMDTRAFGAYKTRTWLQETKLSVVDYTALAAGIVLAAILVTVNYLIKQ